MFTLLVASGRPPHGPVRAVPGSMLSLGIHGLLLGGAVVAPPPPQDAAPPLEADTAPIVLPHPAAPVRAPVAPALPRLDRPLGELGTLNVIRSSNRGFEKPARDALSGCAYRPGRMRGEAVPVLIRQPVRFEIVRQRCAARVPRRDLCTSSLGGGTMTADGRRRGCGGP